MMVNVTLDETEILEAIAKYIGGKSGLTIDPKGLFVEVKSKQNYKSEWETAAIRVNCSVYSKVTA